MLEREKLPLEIVGIEVHPSLCAETGMLKIMLDTNFVRPNLNSEPDGVRFIVAKKKE